MVTMGINSPSPARGGAFARFVRTVYVQIGARTRTRALLPATMQAAQGYAATRARGPL